MRLIAYVDTVYPTGMVAKQPFRIEGGGGATTQGGDMARLATGGIAFVEMKVTGKASHAGAAPVPGDAHGVGSGQRARALVG